MAQKVLETLDFRWKKSKINHLNQHFGIKFFKCARGFQGRFSEMQFIKLDYNKAMAFTVTYINPFLLNDFPSDIMIPQINEISDKFKFKFRLLDGDGNVYFEGVSTRNDSFDPLDFLGGEYGCTDLEFFENGKFVSL